MLHLSFAMVCNDVCLSLPFQLTTDFTVSCSHEQYVDMDNGHAFFVPTCSTHVNF